MTKTPGLFGTQIPWRDVHALIYDNGWKEPVNMVKMVATIDGESSRFTGAIGRVNDNGTQDWGLFQLNSGHWSDYADSPEHFYAICIDPAKAAPIARALWDKDRKTGGSGFGPWFAYGGTAYKNALPAACRGIANFSAVELGIPLVI